MVLLCFFTVSEAFLECLGVFLFRFRNSCNWINVLSLPVLSGRSGTFMNIRGHPWTSLAPHSVKIAWPLGTTMSLLWEVHHDGLCCYSVSTVAESPARCLTMYHYTNWQQSLLRLLNNQEECPPFLHLHTHLLINNNLNSISPKPVVVHRERFNIEPITAYFLQVRTR